MSDSTQYTPDQLAAARDDAAANLAAPIAVTPPAVNLSGASATEADVAAMLAQMKRMQDQLDALQAERAARNAPALEATAEALRDQLKVHASGISGATADHTRALSLADDTVDAARNAVKSGDVGPLRTLTNRLVRALEAVHPGPGDHHYFAQALGMAKVHLHNAMDDFTADQAPAAPVPSGKVLEGSVTG